MLTFEKVLETFEDYLAQDKSCEVLDTSRGHLVVDWEGCKNHWVTVCKGFKRKLKSEHFVKIMAFVINVPSSESFTVG